MMTRALMSRAALLATVYGTLYGCSAVQHPDQDYATKHVGVPEQFSEAGLGASTNEDIAEGWLSSFNDPTLESLVREAWAHNPDLYIAAARFEEAAASLRIAASYLSPELNGGAGARYQYNDGDSEDDRYTGSLEVSWELDLWGRLRSDRAYARSIVESVGLEYQQARHSIAAAVAQAYYGLITAKSQLAINQHLLEAERFTSQTTLQRVDAGLGTSLDADLAESSVRLAEAEVHDNLASIRESQRGLELLLGRYPAAEVESASQALPSVNDSVIAVGVPSSLIERRPDVRSAERLVDAAFYNVASARAAKLPQLTLTADATGMLDPSEIISSIAADLFAPIFQGGRLDAEVLIAKAREDQAVGNFAAVALQAFREVENALSSSRSLAQREKLLIDASERLRRASESAISRYDQGLMTILELQQIRTQDFETRSLLLAVRYQRIVQQLDLFLALGGPVLEAAADEASDPALSDEQEPSDITTGRLHVGVKGTQNQQGETDQETDHDEQ